MPFNLIRNLYSKPILVMLLMALTCSAHAGNPKHPKPGCETCNLNGPTTGFVGQAGMFVLTTGTTAGWTVTNGATIIRSTSTTVTVQFNNTGITNVETAGATCGGASINVSVTNQPLTAPSISESSGTINYGATPGVISSSGSSGGSCATGNMITIAVYPQLVGGSISPASQTINYNTTPSGLTLSGVSGGNGSYTYQWQSSSNSSFSSPTNVGSGTTTYSPSTLTTTAYYRVAVTSDGVTVYSGTAIVTVHSQLDSVSTAPSLSAQKAIPLVSCAINGASSVPYNTTATFNLDCASGPASNWSTTCGSIQSQTSTSVTILFNSINCSSASISAIGTAAPAKTVTITGVPVPVGGGTISNPSQTINYNSTPTQISASVATGGSCSGSYSYQWYSSPNNSTFTAISGATGQNYQPGTLTATTYFKRLTTCGSSSAYTTNTATVTVYAALGGGSVNSSQTINYNTTPSTLTLSGVSGGSGSYTYQWLSSSNGTVWSTISGATGTSYSPPSLTSTAYYLVAVTSNGVTVNSNYATITVYAILQAGSISPSSQTINYNTTPSPLTLSGVSGGNGTYTYQWQSSSNSSFTSPTNVGSGGTTYSPGALTAATYYRVAVTSNGVTTYSSTAVVNVYAQLVGGSISPSTQTHNYNTTDSTLFLSGVSGGSGTYTYQWQSSPNSSFTSPTNVGSGGTTYSPGALASTTYYRVAVTSNGVTTYSSTAVVNVYPQLVGGSISPSSQTINYNTTPSTLTLSGVSGGSGSYTYQWMSSPDNSTWTAISGQTGTSYSPSSLTSTTYYEVVVTSNGVSANSASDTVTVYPQLVGGSISPSSQTINYNTTPSTLTLSGVSGGSGTYTYQWQSSPNSSFASPTNVGSGGTTYSPGALTSTTYYRVAVTSNGVTTYSSMAEDSVYAQLNGGSISPSSQTINNGATPSTLTLSGVTGGNGSYTYQWMSSPDNSTWTAISGQTGTSYSPPALTSTTYYRVVVTSNGVSANSTSATVTVYPPLQSGSISPFGQQIISNTVPSPLTVIGTSGGNGTYTYQWQWSTDLSTWVVIDGQTGATYSPPALTQLTFFQVVVTSNGATATTGYAFINVYPPLQGGSVSPATQSINYNTVPAPIVINDDASGGDGNFTYQWQSSPDNSTWTNISGQTGKSYFPPALTTTTYYRVAVLDKGTSAYSTSAVVTVYPALQPGSLTPTTQTITSGSAAAISLSGTSGGSGTYTYQWQSSYDNSNWTNVSGQTGTTYSPPLVSPGLYYRIAVTSNGVTAYTNSVNVMVNEPLTGGTITGPGGTIGYNTSPGTLGSTQDAYGGPCYPGDYRYQWQYSTDGLNFYNLPGATSNTYTPSTPLTVSLYFRRQASCSANTVYSNTIYVQVTPQAQQNCSAPH